MSFKLYLLHRSLFYLKHATQTVKEGIMGVLKRKGKKVKKRGLKEDDLLKIFRIFIQEDGESLRKLFQDFEVYQEVYKKYD